MSPSHRAVGGRANNRCTMRPANKSHQTDGPLPACPSARPEMHGKRTPGQNSKRQRVLCIAHPETGMSSRERVPLVPVSTGSWCGRHWKGRPGGRRLGAMMEARPRSHLSIRAIHPSHPIYSTQARRPIHVQLDTNKGLKALFSHIHLCVYR